MNASFSIFIRGRKQRYVESPLLFVPFENVFSNHNEREGGMILINRPFNGSVLGRGLIHGTKHKRFKVIEKANYMRVDRGYVLRSLHAQRLFLLELQLVLAVNSSKCTTANLYFL